MAFNVKPKTIFLEQTFHRYIFRPQGKSIFAVLLDWPVNGSVVLSEPVVTQGQTQVRNENTNTHFLIMFNKCHTLCDYYPSFCLYPV